MSDSSELKDEDLPYLQDEARWLIRFLCTRVRRSRCSHGWLPSSRRYLELAKEDVNLFLAALGRFQVPADMKVRSLRRAKEGRWDDLPGLFHSGVSSKDLALSLKEVEVQRGLALGVTLFEGDVDEPTTQRDERKRWGERHEVEDQANGMVDDAIRSDFGIN